MDSPINQDLTAVLKKSVMVDYFISDKTVVRCAQIVVIAFNSIEDMLEASYHFGEFRYGPTGFLKVYLSKSKIENRIKVQIKNFKDGVSTEHVDVEYNADNLHTAKYYDSPIDECLSVGYINSENKVVVAKSAEFAPIPVTVEYFF